MREGAKNALLYPFRNPEQTAEFGLSMAPGSGEAMAARDAWNASGRAGNALLSGDIGQAASEYGNVATGILGAIPGAGIIARGTKRGAAWMDRNLPAGVNKLLDRMTPQASQDTLYAIPAWHGSPHDFDQFKLDKIGTGEGAQAYGHGLYFAESPKVAEVYRDTLGDVTVNGSAADSTLRMFAVNKLKGTLDEREKVLRAQLDELNASPADRPGRDLMLMKTQEQLDTINQVRNADVKTTGRLYRTELDVEPEDLLDWDKPFIDQSPAVKQKFRAIAESLAGPDNPQGLAYYMHDASVPEIIHELTKARGGHDAASQALREAGIPGIRYLDQGSRGAGEGSSNFVIFDDRLVKILGKE